jgi:hypothetical protein
MGLTVPAALGGPSRGAAVREDGVDGVRDLLGAPRELAVCEAERAVAGGGGEDVAGSVLLEGAAGLVDAPAVDLDDEPVLGEEEVDLLALDGLVDAGLGEAVRAAEVLEEVAARSRIVRAGVVTRMPSWVVVSAAVRGRWMRMPDRLRPVRRVVTSMMVGSPRCRAHGAAAEAWLSAASGPHASTAAIQRPLRVSIVCPTASTPWWTTCKRPSATRRSIAGIERLDRRAARAR